MVGVPVLFLIPDKCEWTTFDSERYRKFVCKWLFGTVKKTFLGAEPRRLFFTPWAALWVVLLCLEQLLVKECLRTLAIYIFFCVHLLGGTNSSYKRP